MEAIGYRRVSTVGQIDGEGLGTQTDKIEGWCLFQGLHLAHIHEDAGLSGANMNRPGLQAALAKVTGLGKEGVLVVARLDRLGRNAIEVQVTLKNLLENGCRVVAIADGIDTASGMGASIVKLLVSILASFAELERDIIRSRLTDGRKRAKKEGRKYAVEPHFGLQLVDSKLCADPTETATIQRAKELRGAGVSYRGIGQQLSSEGFSPRRAKTWQPGVIRKLLSRDIQTP